MPPLYPRKIVKTENEKIPEYRNTLTKNN